MLRIIRKSVKTLLRHAGIDIRFIPKTGFDAFDDMRRLTASDSPVVFDVGANEGQSIARFRSIFPRPVIHSFEPGRDAFAKLKAQTANIPDLHLNNVAAGAQNERRTFVDIEPYDM